MRDSFYDDTLAVGTLAPAARVDGIANGAAVDIDLGGQSFRVMMLVVHAGDVTDGTHVVVVEDSPDGSTGWAPVPAGRLQGAPVPDLESGTVHEVGIVPDPTRPFLRAVATSSESTVGAVFGAVILLGEPSHTPVVR